MTRFQRLSTQFLLVCALPVFALAQAPEPGTTSGAHGPIHLSVVVTSSSGGPVADLPRSAFTLLDDGKPAPIQTFRAISAAQEPVRVIVVVDDVNIDYSRLAYERNQIEAFLRANDGQLSQPTALGLVTDTSTELTPGFTKDGNALGKVLDDKEIGLRDLRRSSGFYGATDRLDISLKALGGLLRRAEALPGRKVIVWVSPGWPLLSGPGVQLTAKQEDGIFHEIIGFSAEMRKADVTLYAVDPLGAEQGPISTFYFEEFVNGVRKPSQVSLGDLGLQVLAVQSGGLALNSSNDVASLLRKCLDDTRAYYDISFTPPPADGPDQYHQLEVRVAEPHLKARTRQGYYNQP